MFGEGSGAWTVAGHLAYSANGVTLAGVVTLNVPCFEEDGKNMLEVGPDA